MLARWRSKPIGAQEHQPITGWARGINLKTRLSKLLVHYTIFNIILDLVGQK